MPSPAVYAPLGSPSDPHWAPKTVPIQALFGRTHIEVPCHADYPNLTPVVPRLIPHRTAHYDNRTLTKPPGAAYQTVFTIKLNYYPVITCGTLCHTNPRTPGDSNRPQPTQKIHALPKNHLALPMRHP